jgi:hypothetical protein
MIAQHFPSLILLWLMVGTLSCADSPDFVRDVQPILRDTCYSCHGEKKQKGSLRLDSKPLAMQGGTSGISIKPGDSKNSYFMQRIRGEGDETQMPEKADPLTKEQIAILTAWIDAGAPWPETASVQDATLAKHWAYEKPIRPAIPTIKNNDWIKTPIDAFILDQLNRQNIKPTASASKESLIRRLSLDIIGLPPTPDEVAAFVSNNSDNAYDELVDRLLASPHYGERWARLWLDLARYADTDGFNFDYQRVMWPWRDWVINAFNKDMPYDQFTIEQLAGDLLPNATQEQKIASGFHRNTMVNSEGGVDKDEANWENLIDRTNTTAAVWLASTFGCAQCHNHKYDPFSQRDYYAFLAYFDNAEEVSLTLGNENGNENDKGDDNENNKGKDKGKKKKLATLIFKEKNNAIPETHLRVRGAYVSKGEVVKAATPGFLPVPDPSWPINRLGLARWLMADNQPLTARVMVNRIWETYFGRGLVATSEDFGTQGEKPSHPELLDWLSVEFRESGWSLKKLHRLIVTSNMYRQSSYLTPQALERDPSNQWLARAPRYRLEAELLRDNALVISGLFSSTIGGPSVYPPGPEDLGRINTNKENIKWTTSTGTDAFRRGLYTFWRRTSPYATFTTFDAPSREFCTLKRSRSNTPMQALSALNDPAFWQAAQALGQLMANHAGPKVEDRLRYGLQRCIARTPTDNQIKDLVQAFEKELTIFTQDKKATSTICGGSGDASLAAYIMLANVFLNLDETITRE